MVSTRRQTRSQSAISSSRSSSIESKQTESEKSSQSENEDYYDVPLSSKSTAQSRKSWSGQSSGRCVSINGKSARKSTVKFTSEAERRNEDWEQQLPLRAIQKNHHEQDEDSDVNDNGYNDEEEAEGNATARPMTPLPSTSASSSRKMNDGNSGILNPVTFEALVEVAKAGLTDLLGVPERTDFWVAIYEIEILKEFRRGTYEHRKFKNCLPK